MEWKLPGARENYPGQGVARIELPETPAVPMPVVIAVHGSGRGAQDYWETPFYSHQRQIALEQGCLFAVISNRRDTWGLDDGLYNLQLLMDHIRANYPVAEKFMLWATSAGGVLAHRLVQTCPDQIAVVIGTFPVYDLLTEFGVLGSCRKAWGTEEEAEFRQRIAGKNPPSFADALKGCFYFITHGDADSAVPLRENSLRMAAELGTRVDLQILPGGEHGVADMRYLRSNVINAFSCYRDILAGK